MKKNTIVKLIILLLIAAVLAVGLEALQVLTQPKRYESELRVVREAADLDFSACEITGGTLKESSISFPAEGGELLCDFGQATPVDILRFELKKTPRPSVPVQIWVAEAGQEFTEEPTFSGAIDAKTWDAPVAAGEYAKLKIAFGAKASLKSVTYSEGQSEKVPVKEPMHADRILIMTGILFAVLLMCVHARPDKHIANAFRGGWTAVTEKPAMSLINLGIFLVSGTVAGLLTCLAVSGSLFGPLLWPQTLFCVGVGFTVACMATFRKTLGKKPEIFFVIVCLMVGGLISLLLPTVSVVNFDDDTHYIRTVAASYLGEERHTSMDEDILAQTPDQMDFFDLSKRDKTAARQNEAWEAGVISLEDGGLELTLVYYLFPGLGLYLGRVLGLSFQAIYALGRLFNLLTYTLAGYFGIRRLRSGKMILACSLLIPQSLFMASVYAYDPGVIAFCALGLAYWFAEWQEPEKPLTWGNALVMIGALCLGCLSKAIYFPMLILPFFLPKTKFDQPRKALWFRLVAVAGILLLLGSFLLPMVSGNTTSDTRGGDDVDAYGQMAWMLGHIPEYFGIMFESVGTLLAKGTAPSVLSLYGYIGVGNATGWIMNILFVVMLLDKDESDRRLCRNIGLRLFGLLVLFGTLCLVVTSMYIIYNPVGTDGIGGVQPRYLLPVVYPALMLLGSGLISRILPRKKHPWITSLMNGILLAGMSFILFSYTWNMIISKFFAG